MYIIFVLYLQIIRLLNIIYTIHFIPKTIRIVIMINKTNILDAEQSDECIEFTMM